MEKIVVTRHTNLPALLIQRGMIDKDTPVFHFVNAVDITGKHVVGILPLILAAKTGLYTEVPLRIPFERRSGEELSLEELNYYALAPHTFKVEEIFIKE